jgi:hypothetical protein
MRKVVLCLGLLGGLVDSPALATYSLRGLGDLPGGSSSSNAFDLSADGSVVTGLGNSASSPEAFRWTSSSPSRGSPGDLT